LATDSATKASDDFEPEPKKYMNTFDGLAPVISECHQNPNRSGYIEPMSVNREAFLNELLGVIRESIVENKEIALKTYFDLGGQGEGRVRIMIIPELGPGTRLAMEKLTAL